MATLDSWPRPVSGDRIEAAGRFWGTIDATSHPEGDGVSAFVEASKPRSRATREALLLMLCSALLCCAVLCVLSPWHGPGSPAALPAVNSAAAATALAVVATYSEAIISIPFHNDDWPLEQEG